MSTSRVQPPQCSSKSASEPAVICSLHCLVEMRKPAPSVHKAVKNTSLIRQWHIVRCGEQAWPCCHVSL